MKLILLYGPPAVGKLTVAKALQEVTGFKILHNHLISDLVLSAFERNAPEATDLNHQIRCLIYESAARSGLRGLISTVIYRYNIKDQVHAAVREYADIIERYGSEICVVRLSCATEKLKERVASPSRQGTRKISSVEKLGVVLEQEDLLREIPATIVESFHIDNTDLAPDQVARRIKSHFGL